MTKSIHKMLNVSAISISFISSVIFTYSSFAQDVHFSQFTMAPQHLSPAMIGVNHDIQANVNYKDQWSSIGSSFKTIAAAVDVRLNQKNARNGYLVAGINMYSDKVGDSRMQTNFVNLNLGYHVFLSKYSMLGMAIGGGYGQRSLDYSSLSWGMQYDGASYNAVLPSGEMENVMSANYPDLSAGMVYTFKENPGHVAKEDGIVLNVGVGAYHLLKPELGFNVMGDNLYRRYTGFVSALFQITNMKIGLEPAIMYSNQGPNQELVAGSYVSYLIQQSSRVTGFNKGSKVSLGVFYRAKDAFITGIRYQLANFSAGISYDLNLSRLMPATNGRGGMEVSLRFVSPNPYSNSRSKSMF